MEKKLCRHRWLSILEWYDKKLPGFYVMLWNIRELRLTTGAHDQKQLTFDQFPWTSIFAFFIKVSYFAWARLEPLLLMMIDTNDCLQAFGPSAYILDVTGLNPSIERTRAHHMHGRISMSYNIATTIIECSKVQLYNYEVRVKMAPVLVKNADDTATGRVIHPKPPYSHTTIHKELQRISFNREQIFYTPIMICKGPKTGFSGVVVSYDHNDPL